LSNRRLGNDRNLQQKHGSNQFEALTQIQKKQGGCTTNQLFFHIHLIAISFFPIPLFAV